MGEGGDTFSDCTVADIEKYLNGRTLPDSCVAAGYIGGVNATPAGPYYDEDDDEDDEDEDEN